MFHLQDATRYRIEKPTSGRARASKHVGVFRRTHSFTYRGELDCCYIILQTLSTLPTIEQIISKDSWP